MSKLSGKNILITGASQGLGREIALRFAREGAAGLSLVARHADQLNKVRDEIRKIAPKIDIVVIEADVSKSRDIERMVATTLAQFKGNLDVLVNNASTIGPSPMPNLLDYPVEDFREVIDTNLIGPFLLIKNALPAMIERGGSIINVTSDAGQVGYPGWGAYGISKFGLEGMSQTWASELEETGVRVNWVDPGSKKSLFVRIFCDRRGLSARNVLMSAPFTFTLPPELSAKEPPERRGISRDQVRLLVIDRASGKIQHSRFDKIDTYLRANDLLVF